MPFLTWKYDENPDVNFQWLVVESDEKVLGYFVFTTVHGRVRTAVNVYDWSFDATHKMAFSMAVKCLSRLGSFVSFWGRYHGSDEDLLRYAGLKRRETETRLVLKRISEKGYPEELTLTRIDTDY